MFPCEFWGDNKTLIKLIFPMINCHRRWLF